MKETTEVRNALETAQRHARRMSEILAHYAQELAAADGKLYNARVTRIDRRFIDTTGLPVHYVAIIEPSSVNYNRLNIYASALGPDGYTINGTRCELSGEYLGAPEWITEKPGKTKQYFTAAPMITQVRKIAGRIHENMETTAAQLQSLDEIAETLGDLQRQRLEITAKINALGDKRAYFSNKNMLELFGIRL